MASGLQIEVVPFGPDAQVADAAVRAALGHSAVRGEIEDVEHRVLSVRPVGDADAEPSTAVEATVYDYTNERALVVEVPRELRHGGRLACAEEAADHDVAGPAGFRI